MHATHPRTRRPVTRLWQVGELLLSFPQQLEPFSVGNTLSALDPQLAALAASDVGNAVGCPAIAEDRGGGGHPGMSGEDEPCGGADPLIEWLQALSHATVDDYLSHIALIPRLGPLGAKQLAADSSYLSNIISAGLGLPLDCRLAALERLLARPDTPANSVSPKDLAKAALTNNVA